MHVEGYETPSPQMKVLQYALSRYVYNRSLFFNFTQVEHSRTQERIRSPFFPKNKIVYKLLYSYFTGHQSKCLLLKGGADDEWERGGYGLPRTPSSYALVMIVTHRVSPTI